MQERVRAVGELCIELVQSDVEKVRYAICGVVVCGGMWLGCGVVACGVECALLQEKVRAYGRSALNYCKVRDVEKVKCSKFMCFFSSY